MNWNRREKNGVTFITFPIFEKAGLVHGFSTKLGGVSTGDCATMNLSFHRGDDPDAVLENHRRSRQIQQMTISPPPKYWNFRPP